MGNTVYLPYKSGWVNPYMLLCLYISVLSKDCEKLDDLYLFPPLMWNKDVKQWKFKPNCKISYSAAYSAFKKLLEKFGLDPKLFALHSPRVGGTTDLLQNKMPKRIIDKLGRWKCRKTKYRYGCDKKAFIVKQLQKQPGH